RSPTDSHCMLSYLRHFLVTHPPRLPSSLFLSFFFLSIRPPPRSTLFPYTTLFRSWLRFSDQFLHPSLAHRGARRSDSWRAAKPLDRKSTRLNSSHVSISYAVFCLKKKKKKKKRFKSHKDVMN